MNENGAKFELGRVVVTRGVLDRMNDAGFKEFVHKSFSRYTQCFWGTLPDEDKELNDLAVKAGEGRIMGSYFSTSTGEKIWIITEHDRSATTILFPEEY